MATDPRGFYGDNVFCFGGSYGDKNPMVNTSMQKGMFQHTTQVIAVNIILFWLPMTMSLQWASLSVIHGATGHGRVTFDPIAQLRLRTLALPFAVCI